MPLSDPFATAGRLRPAVSSTLSALTGVRSGKNSYYREMRRTEERMTSAVRALEVISSTQVLTRDDPRTLLHEVLRAAADHLGSDWTMIALRGGAVTGLAQRFVALGPHARVITSDLSLPAPMRAELRRTDRELVTENSVADGLVRVPMLLDGQVLGALVASQPASGTIEHEDHWVLRILVNQAAVALHTASMLSAAGEMRTKAQELYNEIARSSKDLQTRTAQLEQAEDRLRLLHQRELLDAERHRIAAELHDSVAQYVLSAGYAVDVCRAEAAERADGASNETVDRLSTARDMIATAGDQVRSAIYALHHEPAGGESAGLAQLLQGLAAQHRHDLEVAVRIEGRPVSLSPEIVRALARLCGEALFNIVTHAKASRASVRVRYTATRISLSIGDDGVGEPRDLRRLLRREQAGDADGRHQGLAGMARRADGIGARFTIGRSTMGGIRLGVSLPLKDPDRTETRA